MGKVKGKHRLDKYYHLAKEHGYRSRAAWKLVQLDAKFSFLRSSRGVLDLCAAPGGWMQVCVERVPVGSLVLGVDLDPIRSIRGAIAIQEDITQSKCRATIKRLMSEHKCGAFDLVLHDGSPNVGGAWAKEATSQNALVIDSVKLACELLAPRGTFITKIFRSRDYNSVLYCLRQLFEKVEVDKPLASRSASAEIYLVGLKYKAPAKIDPRLLDVKHLFSGGQELPKVVDVLRDNKAKRHRDGYEEGISIMHKVFSAADFIKSDTPLEILGSVTCIKFDDPASLPIKDHKLTTDEVKALCDDLRVLGKQDFKHLLKWRMHIRKSLSDSSEKIDTPMVAVDEEKKEEDDDERLLNEMEELTYAMDRKKKRDKKIDARRRAKDKARKSTGMQIDATQDGYGDQDLFSITAIKGKDDLVAVDNNEYDDEAGESRNSDSEEDEEEKNSASDVDSEEERRRYDDHVEELLDEAYQRYLARTEGSTKAKKRSKLAHSKDDQILQDGDEAMIQLDQDSDNEKTKEKNPLMVPLTDEPTQEEIAAKWFSQDVFTEPDELMDDSAKFDSDDEMQIDSTKPSQPQTFLIPSKPDKKDKKINKIIKSSTELPKPEVDFEVVPAPRSDSDSSSESESEPDVETKAEILAYAKKMISKKPREEMIDDAYNRYLFYDDGLPKWFEDEEKKHRVPMKPITKEEVNAMKAQFKEIDARPVKKVAEAKLRKKRAAHRRLEKVRKKANTISDEADLNDRSKRKMIEKLYNKATATQRPKKELVVAKKGVKVKIGKGQKLVDPRMKKDLRASRGKKDGSKGKGTPKGKGAQGTPKGKGSSFKGSGGKGKVASGGKGRKGKF